MARLTPREMYRWLTYFRMQDEADRAAIEASKTR